MIENKSIQACLWRSSSWFYKVLNSVSLNPLSSPQNIVMVVIFKIYLCLIIICFSSSDSTTVLYIGLKIEVRREAMEVIISSAASHNITCSFRISQDKFYVSRHKLCYRQRVNIRKNISFIRGDFLVKSFIRYRNVNHQEVTNILKIKLGFLN